MLELQVLQAVRLKGRASADALASGLDLSADAVRSELAGLREQGLVDGDATVRITPDGRVRLQQVLADERAELDAGALATAYADFEPYNTQLKEIVSAWQLTPDGTPNDHQDASYDEQVIERLTTLHGQFRPLVQRVVGVAPRLAPYPGRFGHAIERVCDGEHSYVARPIMDSYHTVWFEFHEELIGLIGRSRAEEAAAGRAV